jgi:dihydroneopterin aldolase
MNAPRLADEQRALRHVFLRDMVLHASVGVHGFEHEATQRIRVNVDLAVEDDAAQNASRAAPSFGQSGRDELSRVVDYEAERLAEACLADPRVHLVRIRVEKLDIFADTASVGVEIERRNGAPRHLIPHPG